MDGVRNVYFHRTTSELRTLRSKKASALQRLAATRMTYFDQQEARKLRQQIIWIDAVLASREAQEALL